MRASYWNGAGLGLALCTVASVVLLKGWAISDQLTSPVMVFDPPFVGASAPWILPGTSKEFTVLLKNLASDEARIEELRFSCPCASGTIAGKDRLPVRIPSRDAVPVKVTVTSRKGENGSVELQFGVVGHIGDRPVEAGAVAAIRFVQHLNAEPPLLTLGKINQADGKRSETVDLWFPEDGDPPRPELTVESDDPCVSALLERFPTPRLSLDGGNRRMIFARVAITVDPKIAPERMKAFVIVRSGANELRIPVLGLIERPSVEKSAP